MILATLATTSMPRESRRRAGFQLSIVAVGLCMLSGRVAQAQSRCPTPTPSALGAVNHMLARDSMALRTFGIMARTVAGLEVMRDSLDWARCAELDRIAFPKSATKYYYRAGSFYTIATEAQPLVDPVTGVMRIREGEHVLVLDTADNLLWPRWRGSGCLVPTVAARIAVEYTLDSPTRRAWLDTLGITTTHADELPRCATPWTPPSAAAWIPPSSDIRSIISGLAATSSPRTRRIRSRRLPGASGCRRCSCSTARVALLHDRRGTHVRRQELECRRLASGIGEARAGQRSLCRAHGRVRGAHRATTSGVVHHRADRQGKARLPDRARNTRQEVPVEFEI